ncbi:unnamed protein product, partial [Ectocarpus fasciculatus]
MRDHEQQPDDRDNEEADGSSNGGGRELRHRAASSAAAPAGRLHGERGRRCHSSADVRGPDVSALSVEIAVATVQNNQRQQRQQREQHNAAQNEHHVQVGLTGVGTAAAAAAGQGSRKAPHRRATSLVSRVFGGSAGSSAARDSRTASLEERLGRGSSSTDRASSIDPRHEGDEEKQAEQQRIEEEEEEEEEQEYSRHQHVVRRHEPQRSVPSVVDLFRLEPSSFTHPTTPAAALPSPLAAAGHAPPAVAASLSAEDLAASLQQAFSVGQHQRRQQTSPPAARYAPSTPPPSVYRDESAATVAPSPTPPDGSTHHATASRRGRSGGGGGEDARSSASPRGRGRRGDGRHQPHHHQDGDQQQQGVLPPRLLEVCTAVPAGVTARDKEQLQVLYDGGVTYPLTGGGDDDDDDDDAEGEEDDDALGALQQQQQQEELSLARHLREASTNTVDAGREGRMAYGGGATADWGAGRSDGYHLRQVRRKAIYILGGEAGGGVAHHHRGSSETMKTMSRSGTPHSRCGTPGSSAGGRSRGGASASVESSYINSLGRGASGDGGGGGGGAMKRPSARLQNEAKHFSDQKRGVTTSYKSEELYKHYHKISFFLVVMGVVIGLGSHGIDEGIEVFVHLGEVIMEKGGALLGGSTGAKFFFFLLYDIVLTGIAAMMTAYFSPGVEGSGIPAMKYMMDTDDLANKLQSFTLVAVVVKKACGLMLAAGGGLNVGREGPYTHLGGMVSYQLIRRVPFFNDILKKETVLRQVLAASVAVGLSSTFAATIGGVLFSIEITTLYYDVGNYFKAFVAAISGTVAVSVLRTLAEGSPEYIERNFSKDEFEVWQYPVFATMGVICGFVGPLYINFRLNMLKLGRKLGKHSIRAVPARRWEYVRAATAVACL